LVALILILVVWSVSRPIGDLYVAYAGGRDIVAGKMISFHELFTGRFWHDWIRGRAWLDDWCFDTEGRPWYDQNWGTHLVYYATFVLIGETGIVTLKLLILLATALFIVLGARQFDTSWTMALLVAGAILISGHAYIDLRPNLVTLMFSPLLLWLLYRTRANPHRMWTVAGVLWLWSNVHGGFMFGLGMAGLWALCLSGAEVCRQVRSRRAEGGLALKQAIWPATKAAAARLWPLPAAVLAAVVLCGLLNPFSYHNLVHPFTVTSGKEGEIWRRVQEWRPAWDIYISFGSVWEFYVILLVFVGLLGSRAALRVRDRRTALSILAGIWLVVLTISAFLPFYWAGMVHETYLFVSDAKRLLRLLVWLGGLYLAWRMAVWLWEGRGRRVFEVALALIVVKMGLESRRFIPLATITTAAMLARELDWLLGRLRLRRAVLAAVGLVMLAGAAALLEQHHFRLYRPVFPATPPHTNTFYRKMIRYDLYPQRAVHYINDNDITGNVFHEWRWEGFLHWHCPQLKLYVGGRAQQVHSVENYRLRNEISHGVRSKSRLQDLGVDLVIEPPQSAVRLIAALLTPRQSPTARPSPWVVVYYDEESAILVDSRRDVGKRLVRETVAGTLSYPAEWIKAWSRALCMSAERSGVSGETAMQAIRRANALRPGRRLYMHVRVLADQQRISLQEAVDYYRQQCRRLDAMQPASPHEQLTYLTPARLEAHLRLAQLLDARAKAQTDPARRDELRLEADEHIKTFRRLEQAHHEWARQWQLRRPRPQPQ
jgi:hypothetical protein